MGGAASSGSWSVSEILVPHSTPSGTTPKNGGRSTPSTILESQSYNPKAVKAGRRSHRDEEKTVSLKARSVREIAKINHSRQDKVTFITPEDVKSHVLAQRGKRAAPNDDYGEVGASSVHRPKLTPIINEGCTTTTQFAPNSFAEMKKKFRLKIEVDPVQVDEPEVSETEGASTNVYESDLIKIPPPLLCTPSAASGLRLLMDDPVSTSMEVSPGPIHPLESSMSNMNIDVPISGDVQISNHGDMMLPGAPVGVGLDGLIRPEDSDSLPCSTKSLPDGMLTPSASKVQLRRRRQKLPMHERIIILNKLGHGSSGIVYKGLDLLNMRLVALKAIYINDKEKRTNMVRELCALYQFIRELSRRDSSYLNMKKGPDNFIVDFYDAFTNMEDGTVLFMMEYMDGGSLQDLINSGDQVEETVIANIAVQALKGLVFLHDSNQLHRDLKPANFLISSRGQVKIADLGILKQLPPAAPGVLQRTNSYVGTYSYMSPERLEGGYYSFPTDVWAFGLSMLTLALGKNPYQHRGGYWDVLNCIRDEPAPTASPEEFSPEFCDFISKCLQKDPAKRITSRQLLSQKFLQKAVAECHSGVDETHGIEELESILMTISVHVNRLQKAARAEYSTEAEYLASCSPSHTNLFGNLWSDTPNAINYRLIFQSSPNNVSRMDTLHEEDSKSKPPKRVLMKLARQLNLSMETFTKICTNFCDNL